MDSLPTPRRYCPGLGPTSGSPHSVPPCLGPTWRSTPSWRRHCFLAVIHSSGCHPCSTRYSPDQCLWGSGQGAGACVSSHYVSLPQIPQTCLTISELGSQLSLQWVPPYTGTRLVLVAPRAHLSQAQQMEEQERGNLGGVAAGDVYHTVTGLQRTAWFLQMRSVVVWKLRK